MDNFFYKLNDKLNGIREKPETTHGQLNERDMGKQVHRRAKTRRGELQVLLGVPAHVSSLRFLMIRRVALQRHVHALPLHAPSPRNAPYRTPDRAAHQSAPASGDR